MSGPLGPAERVAHFKSHPWFRHLPVDGLVALAENATVENYPQGALLVDPNAPILQLRFLIDGKVRLWWNGLHVHDAQAPWPIGLEGVLAGAGLRRRVEALSPARALVVDVDIVLDLLEHSFHLRRAVLSAYAVRLLGFRGGLPVVQPRVGGVSPLPDPAGELDLVARLAQLYGTSIVPAHLDAATPLCRAATPISVPAGQTIWRTGDAVEGAILVMTGEVGAQQAGQSVIAGAGCVVGFVSTLAGRKQRVDLQALTDCRLLQLPAKTLWALVEAEPELGHAWLSTLVRQAVQDMTAQTASAQTTSAQTTSAEDSR